MKNLDLNNYDVQEMNAEEMSVIDGGTLGEFLSGIWHWLVGHSNGHGVSVTV